jgi:hypothetical protein
MIVETIAWARGRGVTELSLNFSVFAEYLRGTALRAVLLKLDRLPARAVAPASTASSSRVAPALFLLRALDRPAACGGRVPARRVAADAARSVGESARPRRALKLFALASVALAGSAAAADWPEFGYIPSRQNVGPAKTGITASNVARLHRRTIQLDGTVDSSPIYVGGMIYVTTTYGRTEAIDARTGKVRWRSSRARIVRTQARRRSRT